MTERKLTAHISRNDDVGASSMFSHVVNLTIFLVDHLLDHKTCSFSRLGVLFSKSAPNAN